MTETNKRPETTINGITLWAYDVSIRRNGQQLTGTTYREWFTDDSDACASLRAMITEQGYTVKSVTVGLPCIAEIA